MEYKIIGNSLPVVICKLNEGESVYTQSGGMGWMTNNITMKTNIKGGILKGITRKFMKESFFMTTYSCTYGQGFVAFPSNFPGSIITFDLAEGESIIAQKNSFLCAESTTSLKMYFQPKPLVGLFGGEGFIMQRIVGPGKVFLEVDGGSIKHSLAEGEILKVDPGHICALSPSVKIRMKIVKGIMNIFFSGEGLLLTELEGPGDVWLQTIPLRNVAKVLAPYFKIRKVKSNNTDEEYQISEE